MNVDPLFEVDGADAEKATVEEVHGTVDPQAEIVPPGTTVHFPQHQPRLTTGGQKVFNALRTQK
jgi:hypothetical protein